MAYPSCPGARRRFVPCVGGDYFLCPCPLAGCKDLHDRWTRTVYFPALHLARGLHVVGEERNRLGKGAALPWVLDRDKHRTVLVVDDRATGFGADGNPEELFDPAAFLAGQRDLVQGVAIADGSGLPVGGDPQVAF